MDSIDLGFKTITTMIAVSGAIAALMTVTTNRLLNRGQSKKINAETDSLAVATTQNLIKMISDSAEGFRTENKKLKEQVDRMSKENAELKISVDEMSKQVSRLDKENKELKIAIGVLKKQ